MDIAPAAIHQRMNKKAITFLPDMIQQTLAKLHALDHMYDDSLFPAFPKVYIADRTGFALPDELHRAWPDAKPRARWPSRLAGVSTVLGPANLSRRRSDPPRTSGAHVGDPTATVCHRCDSTVSREPWLGLHCLPPSFR